MESQPERKQTKRAQNDRKARGADLPAVGKGTRAKEHASPRETYHDGSEQAGKVKI